MISSTSRRLPQKTCGLFDTGFAGGDLDLTTSLGLDVLADNASDPFTFGGLDLSVTPTPNKFGEFAANTTAIEKQDVFQPDLMEMEGWDLLEPLADLEGDLDPLGDASLDAFMDLDQFLMGDAFFDDTDEIQPEETYDVKPVINIPILDATTESNNFGFTVIPTKPMPVVATKPTFSVQEEKATKPTKSRKRKAAGKPSVTEPVKTSMFEIPVAENVVSTRSQSVLDHDYTTKRQKTSPVSGNVQKCSSNRNKGKPLKVSIEHQEPCTSSTCVDTTADVLDKSTMRRIKNNVASKRSREQRKQKLSDMDLEAEQLIIANDNLRKKIIELEKIAKDMKAVLVAKMAGK